MVVPDASVNEVRLPLLSYTRFVDSLLKGVSPIGARFRELSMWYDKGETIEQRGPWQEIVGVVQDVPAQVADYERPKAVWYAPTRNLEPATLLIHVRGTDPTTFSGRLRAITSEVDQGMFLRKVQPLDHVLWAEHLPLRVGTAALVVVAFAVLVLAAAVVLLVICIVQRLPWPLVVYGAAVLVMVVGSNGLMSSKARLLLPAFTLLLPVALALARRRPPTVIAVLGAATIGSAWFGAYALLGWPYAI